MSRRVLVAGVGNVFLGDDGFGTEVASRLQSLAMPDGVRVSDFGVAAMHLAFELLDGCDELILVDAAPRGGEPGRLYVIEPELGHDGHDAGGADAEMRLLADPHALTPDGVLAMVAQAGERIGRVRVVGCEPGSVEEGIGLSAAVAAAVEPAVSLVRQLIEEVADVPRHTG